MYAIEHTYVITYLAVVLCLDAPGYVPFGPITSARTIIKQVSSWKVYPFEVLHTSRIGTGSSKRLSTLTNRLIAETNS